MKQTGGYYDSGCSLENEKGSSMQKLKFITPNGVCGFTHEWDADGSEFDAEGWLHKYGTRVGSGTAPLPNGAGWIDLSQFAVIQVG